MLATTLTRTATASTSRLLLSSSSFLRAASSSVTPASGGAPPANPPGGALANPGSAAASQIYPHTRPAPRLAPVVPLGSAPIPGGGRWSGVQTGAHGLLLPPPGTPEGKPGVIGAGVYKGTQWALVKWQIIDGKLHIVMPALLFTITGLMFYLYSNDKPFVPPPKPAGNYSLAEDTVRDGAHRIRLAEIAARQKAAALKAEAIAAEKSLSSQLESAKDEMVEKVEDLGVMAKKTAAEQLQMLSEKYDVLKSKA